MAASQRGQQRVNGPLEIKRQPNWFQFYWHVR